MSYETELTYWKRVAHERVGRQYHRRECVAAAILGAFGGAIVSITVLELIRAWM